MYYQAVTTTLTPPVALAEPEECSGCDGNHYDESGQACTVCSGNDPSVLVGLLRFLCFWR